LHNYTEAALKVYGMEKKRYGSNGVQRGITISDLLMPPNASNLLF